MEEMGKVQLCWYKERSSSNRVDLNLRGEGMCKSYRIENDEHEYAQIFAQVCGIEIRINT